MVSSLENDFIFLFDTLIEPLQMQLIRVRVDLGVMAMKEYSTFHKAPVLQEPHYQIV